MSDKEMCIKLLESVPEYKIGYVLAYIQGIMADEWDPDYTKLTPEEARQVEQAAREMAAGDYVPDSAVNWD